MKILDSDFSSKILKTVHTKLGNIFFLKYIAVVEIHDGIHFDINNASIIINELENYFKNSKPYGVIANRINSYSVNLINTTLFKKKATNLCAYGVIGHDAASKMNAKLENDFCKPTKVDFDNIYEAINSISNRVKISKSLTLN